MASQAVEEDEQERAAEDLQAAVVGFNDLKRNPLS